MKKKIYDESSYFFSHLTEERTTMRIDSINIRRTSETTKSSWHTWSRLSSFSHRFGWKAWENCARNFESMELFSRDRHKLIYLSFSYAVSLDMVENGKNDNLLLVLMWSHSWQSIILQFSFRFIDKYHYWMSSCGTRAYERESNIFILQH